MEFLSIFLSSLLTITSPAGLVLDSIVTHNLRSRLQDVEELQVRIDNSPSYQLIQGKVERIRIASRGVQLTADWRIDTLELETDPLDLDLQRLQKGGKHALEESLRQPLQGGVRLVFTEADLNQTLQSPEVKVGLQKLLNRLLKEKGANGSGYELLNPHLDLLDHNRLRFQGQLQKLASQDQAAQPLEIMIELGVNVLSGRSLELMGLIGSINGNPLSPQLLNGFARGVSERLDLVRLEKNGILARLLELKIEGDKIQIAAFVRFEPHQS